MNQDFRGIYEALADSSRSLGEDSTTKQCESYRDGLWKLYVDLLNDPGVQYGGMTVCDFGCKTGLVLPLFIAMGAAEAIGIDAEAEYLRSGARLFSSYGNRIRLAASERGYIPLQPDSVDFVLVNEVISHVNPSFLDTAYGEIARILRPGGVVFISDGNNLANPDCREGLADLYEKWENGPDGVRTERDSVTRCFLNRRRDLIAQWHPGMAQSTVQFIAENTSGLFGDHLRAEVEKFAATGILTRRPYRKGVCPTNPGSSGVVMERAFLPRQVVDSLAQVGLESQIWHRPTVATYASTRCRCLAMFRRALRKLRGLKRGWREVESWNFQIKGVKPR